MNGLPPTERALLRLCRLRPGAADRARIRTLGERVDWGALSRLAQRGGVAGLVARNLEGLGAPRQMRLALTHAALLGQARTQPLLDEGQRLCAAACAEGLTLVPLKGTALHLIDVYEPGLRTQCDLDLLAPREELEALDGLLRRAGWQEDAEHRSYALRHQHHLTYWRDGQRMLLELHWTGLLAQFSDRAVERALLARCVTRQVRGQPLRLLATSDLCFLVILHFCFHRFRAQLKWLVDIAELARAGGAELRWDEVYGLARRVGALRATTLAVELARELLDAPIPPPPRRPRLLPALARLAPALALVRSEPQPSLRERALIDLLAYDSPLHGARFLGRKAVELLERRGLRLPLTPRARVS